MPGTEIRSHCFSASHLCVLIVLVIVALSEENAKLH